MKINTPKLIVAVVLTIYAIALITPAIIKLINLIF